MFEDKKNSGEELARIYLDSAISWLNSYAITKSLEDSYKYVDNYKFPTNKKEIQTFIETLHKNYNDIKTKRFFGIYISRAINESKEDYIDIDIPYPFDYIGIFLPKEKELNINGNLGLFAGYKMRGKMEVDNVGAMAGIMMEEGILGIREYSSFGAGFKKRDGIIIVGKNAGNYLGEYMEGGEIIVAGNSGDFTGKGLKGGVINIHGSAGYSTGDEMEGGTIKIGKDCEGFGKIKGGNIIIGNEYIYKDGKKVKKFILF
mgnify:CR=1 FL=1